MTQRLLVVGAVTVWMAAVGLGACSGGTTAAPPATTASTSSRPTLGTFPGAADTATTTSTATATGPVLAGQASATSRSSLGLVTGYQETAVESAAHRLLHTNQPARDTPGTQVHCPAVAVTVGATFVCQVDADATSFIDEPLKVDQTSPLNLEFAVIDPTSFVCSAHAAWVVQAMAQAGSPCANPPTTGQGQGQGQGQQPSG